MKSKAPTSTFLLLLICLGGLGAPIPDAPREKQPGKSSLTQDVLDAIAEGNAADAFAAATKGRAKGDASCTYLLGQMHEQGRGVAKPDAAKAFSLYEEAAAAKVPEAITAIARCLENGIGVPRNVERAMTMWEKAAEAGDPPALGRMALAEMEGQGRAVNHQQARAWAEKAAKVRDPLGLWILSRIYERALAGATANLSRAIELCMQAAQLGQTPAMHQMGRYYAAGQGLPRDAVAAAGWYRLAADFGDLGAMATLAQCFLDGTGVRQNDAAAFQLAATAARGGESRAQYLLGRIFDEGLGCPPAPVFAMAYHLRAAKNGVKEANTAVLRLRTALDPATVAQAEQLAEQPAFHVESTQGLPKR